MTDSLRLLGAGTRHGKRRDVREATVDSGGNVDNYHGWPVFQEFQSDDEQPASVGAATVLEALDEAGRSPKDLDVILYTGSSREHLGSWSVSTEISRLIGAECVCLDLHMGCQGVLMSMELLQGMFRTNGKRKLGAIVCAERWSGTIDRASVGSSAFWAHSDGAAALVVGTEGPARLGVFEGVSTFTYPHMNGFVFVKYGGSRFPIQEGPFPNARVVRDIPRRTLWKLYEDALDTVIGERLEATEQGPPTHGVCNQASPKMVDLIERRLGLAENSIPRTGFAHGHVGGCDTIIGLRELVGTTGLPGNTILVASSPSAFAAASIAPEA